MRYKGLVVEDDLDTQDIFSHILDMCGVDCDIIPSGTRALEYLEENIPDIILMDMHLPGTHGVDIIRMIREVSDFDNTIIIVISADHMMSSTVEEIVDAVILKPVDIRALQMVIKRLLGTQ